MLRQATHILLIGWLLLISQGFAVREHYCLGQLRYTTIDLLDFSGNSCCPPEEQDDMPWNCCQDHSQHFELNEDYTGGQALSLLPLPIAVPMVSSPPAFPPIPRIAFSPSPHQAVPPPDAPDLLVLHQVFRL